MVCGSVRGDMKRLNNCGQRQVKSLRTLLCTDPVGQVGFLFLSARNCGNIITNNNWFAHLVRSKRFPPLATQGPLQSRLHSGGVPGGAKLRRSATNIKS